MREARALPASEVTWLSASVLSRMLRAREISSEELVLEFLDRIDACDVRVNAFVEVLREAALADARSVDQRMRKRGQTLGPFAGVPIGIKDLNLARGAFTRFGSRAFARLFSPFDDATVGRLRRAGFIVLGKTATSELGSLPVTEPDIHPPTRNPWDLEVTPGGSSGGSAAAVAAGMIPVAQGSDAAGSIRIPSALCNLVGIKPSRGRLENPFGFDDERLIWTCGPLARTVEDVAAMLDAMAGITVGTPHWAPPPPRPFQELSRDVPRALRVCFATRSSHVETHPEVAAAVERVARLLERLGHHIEEREVDLPHGAIDEFLPVWQATAARAPVHDWSLTQPVTRWLGEKGRGVDPETVARLTDKLQAQVLDRFGDADAWITPTVPVAPPRVGAWRGLPPEQVFAEATKLGIFTAPFNVSGQPAASVPAGMSREGHPIGVQIAGKPLADALVLAIAYQIEREAPWANLRPDLP